MFGRLGEPAPGEAHPDYPGCRWNPELQTYVCDDGYTVDGDPVFVTSTDYSNADEQQTVQTLSAAGYDTTIKSVRALSQAISNSTNGVLSVPKNSSAYVFAKNNSGLFGSFAISEDPLHPGMYLISASSFGGLALGGGVGIGAAALLIVLLLSSRR